MRAMLVSRLLREDRQTHVAYAPGNGALLARGRRLVCLALDAEIHDVVTADGAVVDDDVPCPQRHGVPLQIRQLIVADHVKRLPERTFFTSNLFFSPLSTALAPALADFAFGAALASVISTSAILRFLVAC